MITTKNDFLGSGMSFADLVEFSPNEPGIPFGDTGSCTRSNDCHQFGDSNTAALPAIRPDTVTNSDIWECF